MKFDVSYKDGSGLVKVERLEARTRNECFSMLSRRGITPLRITAVRDSQNVARKLLDGMGSGLGRGAVLAAVGVVLVAAVIAWALLGNDSESKSTMEKKGPKRVGAAETSAPHAALPPVESPETKDTASIEDASPAVPEREVRYEDGVEVISSVVTTNSTGAVMERLVLANGKKIRKIHPPKPVFDNAADQLIALALATKPGESMPPFPDMNGVDRDFEQALMTPIVINDNDPDDVRELKAKVMEVRAYLAEEVKNGGSLVDALEAHRSEMDRIADSHAMAIQEVQKLMSEGNLEGAREFAENVNAAFEAQGIPPIKVPAAPAGN